MPKKSKIEKIVLSEKDAELFFETLNNPPPPNAALKALFSSKKADWETPNNFFAGMEKLFGKFQLDVCAHSNNHKTIAFYGKSSNGTFIDGLNTPWPSDVLCWMNPPYGRGITGKWVAKAAEEARHNSVKTVCLLPARTDTKWFKICFQEASEIYFVQGRLKFKGAKDSAPFPSMVVVFDGTSDIWCPNIKLMNTKGEIITR